MLTPTVRGFRSRFRPISTIALVTLALGGCYKTDDLVKAFNGGALDTSSGDPWNSHDKWATDLVATRIRQELSDGYFGQGPVPAPYVADWMAYFADNGNTFTKLVVDLSCSESIQIGNLCSYVPGDASPPASAGSIGAVPATAAGKVAPRVRFRQELRQSVLPDPRAPRQPLDPVCTAGARNDGATERFLDFVRFEAAVERAAGSAAEILGEQLVDVRQVRAGAKQAFADIARYLRDRGWHRSLDQRTLALVTKGGASTGIFTAGAVYAVLNLINECMHDAQCGKNGKADFRFQMLSGTSTGAMVAVVTDLYNDVDLKDYPGRVAALDQFAKWFTCSGMSDLYCVRHASVFDLARPVEGQDSLLDFDGLTKKLRGAVKNCDTLLNPSELILNTVDFRSGSLLALSDQEEFSLRTPEDVVQGALASAVEPVIVRPAYKLSTSNPAALPRAYLDGGIRSELPIFPVVRRGAERTLVVGSDASVSGESPPLLNGLSIAARYVDVTLAGVMETELAQSQRYAESIRLAERDACLDALGTKDALDHVCPFPNEQDAQACRTALCGGSWDAHSLCPGGDRTEAVTPPASDVAVVAPKTDTAPAVTVTPSLRDRLAPFWQMVELFRNERRVEPLHGYSFIPAEQRRLFLAGTDATRVSCVRIAKLLGIDVPQDPNDPLRRRIVAWCSPSLAPDVCGGQKGTEGPPPACTDPIPNPPPELEQDCRGGRP